MAAFDVDGRFRLVYVVFNTIFALLSQDAQVACFRRVADVLEPGGSFVLECFVPDLGRFDRGQSLRAVGVSADAVRVDASRHDPVNQRVNSGIVWIRQEGVSMRPVNLRYAWPSELDLMAQLAGLELRDRWAGWDRQPFTAASGVHVSIYSKPGG